MSQSNLNHQHHCRANRAGRVKRGTIRLAELKLKTGEEGVENVKYARQVVQGKRAMNVRQTGAALWVEDQRAKTVQAFYL